MVEFARTLEITYIAAEELIKLTLEAVRFQLLECITGEDHASHDAIQTVFSCCERHNIDCQWDAIHPIFHKNGKSTMVP